MNAKWHNVDNLGERESALPLMQAYNDVVSGFYNTSNVVRYIEGGDKPRLFVQHQGQIAVSILTELEERSSCQVYVRSLSPQQILIMMFGRRPKAYPSTLSNYLYREM